MGGIARRGVFLLPRTFYFTSGLFLVRGGGLFLFNTNLFDFEQRIKTGLFIFPDPLTIKLV